MRVAVVTGGSAGIGRATVREFANQGFDVAVLARSRDGLDGAVKEIEAAGRRGLAIAVDVSDYDAVERAADQVERELGPIDVWVNNAMVGVLAPVSEMTPAEFRRLTEVNYLGQVWGTMAAVARMRPRDRGVVVNVGSALAFRGIPLQSAYCASKHAIKGFSESLIAELRHEKSKVHVCMVQLPGVNSTQFDWVINKMPKHPMPVPPIYQPEIPARAIVWLAQHPRRNMWVGIATAGTILANRAAPKVLDIYLGLTGYKSQQTDEFDKSHQNNVFEPLPGDRGAHGAFDAKAHDRSPMLWLSTNRRYVVGGMLTAAAFAGSVVVRRARV